MLWAFRALKAFRVLVSKASKVLSESKVHKVFKDRSAFRV